ncbi:competence type IV pilus ATPase ComGA [Amphibacillus sediminis]|uniref:competence type IV pilus ATPase ComGA n=1 Tax=Amphibacillus sediminis TaxID=360185 RepID=UPI00402B7FEF
MNHLIKKAININATDIHFCPNGSEITIYFRINGGRYLDKSISLNQYRFVLNYLKFSSGMDIGETRKAQDGAVVLDLDEQVLDLRLSTLPLKRGQESLAIRLLKRGYVQKLDQLFLFPYQLSSLEQIITRPSGVILFTGATGSGKSTILYALLEYLASKKPLQIITLEDPVEKNLPHLLQIQIDESHQLSYHDGLKAALRHDPDLIMVGEIRDRETAKFVFHAAYTGHLVLSTLHAKNVIGTIHRLIEMGVKPIDLAQNLLAVCALELLPIKQQDVYVRRAAIMELLSGDNLNTFLDSLDPDTVFFQTFEHLKRKAIAYGFTE